MTGPWPSAAARDLVVDPEDQWAEPLNAEGAGLFSSVADTAGAVSDGDALGATYAGLGLALDAVGMVMSPLDPLGEAGLGWLIEHVWFLHEPLDWLAGDPAQITATAQTWHEIAGRLREVAADQVRGAAGAGWEGQAAEAYRAATSDFAARLGEAAGHAEELAGLVLGSGAAVGTVRALLRDRIAAFLWSEVIGPLLLAGVLAVATAGGSATIAVAAAIVRAIDFATDVTRDVGRLALRLADAGATSDQIAERLVVLEHLVRTRTRPALAVVEDAADVVRARQMIEIGKQFTGAEGDRETWS